MQTDGDVTWLFGGFTVASALAGVGWGEEIVQATAEVRSVVHIAQDAGMQFAKPVDYGVAESGGIVRAGGLCQRHIIEEHR